MKKNIFLVIVLLLLCVGIGYAYLTRELNINGTYGLSSNTWDVHFNNISNQKGVTPTVEPSIIDNTSISYAVNLSKLGDYYSFTVDVVNSGSIDAMIDVVSNYLVEVNGKTYSDNLIIYWVKYVDEIELAKYNLLEAGTTDTIKVYAKFNDEIDIDDLPSEDLTLTGNLTITYIPADENAVERDRLGFADMTWAQIQERVQSGNLAGFNVGDTKCVALDGFTTTNDNGCEDGEFLVRIVNMSTPSECGASDFSESACGFVVEFVDIITTHNMNPSGVYGTPGDAGEYDHGSNRGGWPGSELYKYINLVAGDESSGTIYKALPSELKSVIKDTRVVSGHGSNDANNFTSIDKLYLLATAEVWAQGSSNMINYDSARDKTRQLDYYANLGVTTNNYSGAIKKRNGSADRYWLRAPYSALSTAFCNVIANGDWSDTNATISNGVAVAFRIG